MGMRLRICTPIDFKHLSLKGLLVISFTLWVGIHNKAWGRGCAEREAVLCRGLTSRTTTLDSGKREEDDHAEMVAWNVGLGYHTLLPTRYEFRLHQVVERMCGHWAQSSWASKPTTSLAS
ncbi:unnamed protein product [Hapterophycus canaliculatus]